MRELILLRHAHAKPIAPGQDDADRELSQRGRAEADAVALWLQAEGLRPTLALCSPARRTRATLDAVLEKMPACEARCDPRIYAASPGTLMAVLDEHTEIERVLMVGHNPGFEQLAALLHSGQSGEFRGMPTAAVAVLTLPPSSSLEPGIGTLTRFWWP